MPTNLSVDVQPRQRSSFYLDRVRESISQAEREPLKTRKLVHLAAADRWLRLAATAKRIESRLPQLAPKISAVMPVPLSVTHRRQ
jgi:hypothetical protein